MEYDYLTQLDDFFCEQYSDYVKIAAIEGYRMPEMLTVGADGNIARRDPSCMRICHQQNKGEILARFKASYVDTEFTFNFSCLSLRRRIKDRFRKYTFAKLLPVVLKRYKTTPQEAGELLALDPVIWRGIVKGKFLPEKNTLMALALVCRMQTSDVNNLFIVCGTELKQDNVRDVVFEYLLNQKIFNREMIDRCLAEYHIDTLPLRP